VISHELREETKPETSKAALDSSFRIYGESSTSPSGGAARSFREVYSPANAGKALTGSALVQRRGGDT